MVGGGLVGGTKTGVIKSSSPLPDSCKGGHSSSSSPLLQPDPAPLNTRSSVRPGKPEAGVCKLTRVIRNRFPVDSGA